ncbi:MAG: (5-formylfuran-3-yl)methyl phosphate synthase [Gemmataceae bacterium]
MTATSFVRPTPGLLVSVRDVTEAKAALSGGADLIDVKEPSRGSLGYAGKETAVEIVRAVAGRRPVSAASGELSHFLAFSSWPPPWPVPGVALTKIGLAGCNDQGSWNELLELLQMYRERWLKPKRDAELVIVAYADWQRAEAPPPSMIARHALQHQCGLLIDTWGKDGSTLLHWMSVTAVTDMCDSFRAARVPIALAGSLSLPEIDSLRTASPDWFAVRGAACDGGREGVVQAERVRRIKAAITSPENSSIEPQ